MLKYILSFLLFTSVMFSQSESQIGWIAKFGAAGGFTPMIMFPNFDDINPEISKLNIDQLDGPILAWGGGGYAYIMIIDNFRLGGVGFSGAKTRSNNFGDFNNEVNYSLGGGAVTAEYTMPFIKGMALSAGIMIGGGSLEIDIYRNIGDFNWNSVWDKIVSGDESQTKEFTLDNSFWFFTPTLNLDLPITRFLALRGGLGYQFTFGNEWEIANSKKLNDVPSGINGNGLVIQTGILIGLFAF